MCVCVCVCVGGGGGGGVNGNTDTCRHKQITIKFHLILNKCRTLTHVCAVKILEKIMLRV